MRKHVMVAAAVATLGLTFVCTGTAQADSQGGGDGSNWGQVLEYTANGYGEAWVNWSDSAGGGGVSTKTDTTYAVATFYDANTGYSLNGWLEREHDGTWTQVSGTHALTSNLNTSGNDTQASTDAYYDGPGYLVEACFQFTSWSGAAVHCTPAI